MNRREFLSAGAGFAGACAFGGCAGFCGNRTGFKLAMAGYTLNRFKTDEALDFCEKNSFRYLCVKDFHLPFKSTAAEISEFKRKCADHGVTPYGVGPIYMEKPEDARRYFDYAAALGVDILVGVPGEPFTELGARIYASSPFKHTMTCCMTNAGCGYVPNSASFDEGGYEMNNCNYVRGADDVYVAAATEALEKLSKM